jgi:hypothetical protein
MAHISIFVGGISQVGSDIRIVGQARTSDMSDTDDPLYWEVDVAFSALAATINDAIRDAAIAAAVVASHSVGGLDKKTIYAGAVGL